MSFNDFAHKYKLKNKATSHVKIYQVLPSLSFNNVGVYIKDGPFESDIGIINLHLSERTHWVAYVNEI